MPMEIFSPIGKTISDKNAEESSSLATSPTILRGSLNSSQGGSDHLTPPLSNLADTKVRFTPSADGLEFESKLLKSSSSHSLSSQPSRSKSHSDISSAINQQSSKLNSSETPSSTTGRSAEREQNENMSRPEQATLHSQAVNAKHQVRADENVPPNQTLNTTTFQLQLLENVVDDCLSGFRASVRNDVQNMHLELLRQFQIQKAELEAMFRKYTNIDALVEEVERLREENKRLKMNF
ncbi:hypothetical protein BKA69DRAFT_1064020 [Paraphysoderma sedebokerense]|nr:hypothetical protein BKA69DRAFT_1064020 [Paraphysoderma sedebokerense]